MAEQDFHIARVIEIFPKSFGFAWPFVEDIGTDLLRQELPTLTVFGTETSSRVNHGSVACCGPADFVDR